MLRTPRTGTLGYFNGSGGVGSTIPSLQYLTNVLSIFSIGDFLFTLFEELDEVERSPCECD